jgi:hypothetical protein
MDGEIHVAGEQRLLYLLDETGLVRDLGGAAAPLVARCRDRNQLDLVRQPLRHPARLGERQCASARP